MPEDNECCACLSVILLDSVVIVDKKYYSQIFLKECKYGVKKKKIINSNNEKLSLMNLMKIKIVYQKCFCFLWI